MFQDYYRIKFGDDALVGSNFDTPDVGLMDTQKHLLFQMIYRLNIWMSKLPLIWDLMTMRE